MRLFNLAVDVPSASLTVGGAPLAHGVQYSLGSKWVPVPATQQTFAASGSGSAAPLASAPFTPPNAPEVFTTFMLGSKAFGYSLLPQVDAPGQVTHERLSRFSARTACSCLAHACLTRSAACRNRPVQAIGVAGACCAGRTVRASWGRGSSSPMQKLLP